MAGYDGPTTKWSSTILRNGREGNRIWRSVLKTPYLRGRARTLSRANTAAKRSILRLVAKLQSLLLLSLALAKMLPVFEMGTLELLKIVEEKPHELLKRSLRAYESTC